MPRRCRVTPEWNRAIPSRLVNRCWTALRGVLTLVVVGVLALGTFLYFRLDEEAQRLSERALARYCQPFVASVQSASITPGRGVTMHGVQIIEQVSWQQPRGVLQIDELQVQGDFEIATLLRGKPTIRRIIARGARLAATRRADGTWNIADIHPPAGDGPTPSIELRDATILLTDERADQNRTLVVRRVNATIAPSSENPQQLQVDLSASNALAESFEAHGVVAKDGSAAELRYSVRNGRVSNDTFARLGKLGLLRALPLPIEGGLSADGKVTLRQGQPLLWSAEYRFAANEYRPPQAKRPLREIRLAGSADQDGVRIDQGAARWGEATISLTGARQGWSFFSPFQARVVLNEYDLASTPAELLPAEAAKLWRRFRPMGLANIEASIQFDGRRLLPTATVTALNASFEDAERFPYRVTQATGQIRLNGGVTNTSAKKSLSEGANLDVDLHAQGDEAPIHITAAFRDLRPPRRNSTAPRPMMPLGWVEIQATSLPVSPRLVSAIPEPGARDFVRELNPAGHIDVRWRAERDNPQDPKTSVALDMRLANCRMIYDRFPYPLSGVTGWVRQRGDQWAFSELRSRDTQGRIVVEGHGSLEPRTTGCGFELTLTGKKTPLNQTLFDALPSDAQQAWTVVQPDGLINFEAFITRQCGELEPRVRLVMRPHEQNLSISPPLSESGYRYRFERVGGEFEWMDNRLTIRRGRAMHGRTVYTSDGLWESLDNGAWRLALSSLNVDRLDFGRDFLLAAPAGLRTAIETLQPRGGYDLFNAQLEITQTTGVGAKTDARWKGNLACHQGSVNPGVALEGLSGVVAIAGSSDGVGGVVAAELDLDSVFWNDLQLTEVRGPLWADGTDLLLGEGVARQVKAEQKRPVLAKAYGGDVSLNSWVRSGGRTQYGLAIGMAGVDVTRFSSEWLQRPEALDGVMEGTLELQGLGPSMYGLTGRGKMTVNDADLYELPLFLALLKYLRNRAPDSTAFGRLETEFTLEGNNIQFKSFDLLGDAVSLYGKGTATLQRDVDLTFASIVGRNEFSIPVLKAFVSSASEQLLRLRVVGPLDAPEVRREVLPAVGNVLEQLQTEFGGRVTTSATRPTAPTRR